MKTRFKANAAAVAAVLVMLTTAIGTAHASTDSVQGSFATQARSARLTSAQVQKLQGEVNAYVAKSGGKQVSLNKVKFKGGSMLFVVPGEKYARDLGAQSSQVASTYNCKYGHFCAYSKTWYAGSVKDVSACGTNYYISFTGPGSWKNNQTTGLRAQFLDKYFNWIDSTPNAYSADPNGNWTPVYYVNPC
ncbi:hypothetical protein [Streptomyces sp. AK02-04a]|uniref:hypothetical protein n=1 Tax=Streptomyces sp. AK02-04a TaxID=3028649 RepID=UPI0029AD0DF6|nr:hypothetical protein [Streptomyces sp. AK02-04a]MDX3762815.1 hypothetical protein [Streptomyces sp. AK02-04a]